MKNLEGTVQTIELLTTAIKDFSGNSIILPNKLFTEGYVINLDTKSQYLISMKLHLHPEIDVLQVQETIELLRKTPWPD